MAEMMQSDRLTLKLGTGKVTAISVAMTALVLFGFPTTHNFWLLCLWVIPYGLGGGTWLEQWIQKCFCNARSFD